MQLLVERIDVLWNLLLTIILITGLIGWINDFIAWVYAEFTKLWNAFWTWVKDFWDALITQINNATKYAYDLFIYLKDWIFGEFDKFKTWILGEWSKFSTWVSGEFGKFWTWITGEFSKFYTWVTGEFSKFSTWITGEWSKFWTWITGEFTKFKDWVLGEWNKFVDWVKGELNKFIEAIKGGPAWLAEGVFKILVGWIASFNAGFEDELDKTLKAEKVELK